MTLAMQAPTSGNKLWDAVRPLAVLVACSMAFNAANAQLGVTHHSKPEVRPCPPGVAADTRCLSGRDSAGAYYWLAVPPNWNGVLALHAHGGPELGEPKAERASADLTRWSIWTRAGYAYAGSGFHLGGVEVRSAAQDTERVRQIFNAEVGVPRRTILHGQSWGAGVAAKAAEMFARSADGKSPYDGLLLSSGVLGGGSQSYNFRLDLRAVYQAVCGNHPRADEAAYPLWQGLPPGHGLTRAELATRVDECTGVRKPAAQRSASQERNLKTLTQVISIPESALLGHLNWATWHFQDIVFNRLGGRNPFGNIGVRYRGSDNDEALNTRVARYEADPKALALLAQDTDLQGPIAVPVLTLHGIDDATAFVELESVFRDTLVKSQSANHLVQTFTRDHEHSYQNDAHYVAAMAALLDWIESGRQPTPANVAERCLALGSQFDATHSCRFAPDFHPNPLSNRVPVR